jgi:Flp pilus assembly pilin Flp
MWERHKMNLLNSKARQAGQGMTEYIIIVALVAVAAISVYNIFGDTVRGQVGNMASELGGGKGTDGVKTAVTNADKESTAQYDLSDFNQDEK